jgi:hypothetical protein
MACWWCGCMAWTRDNLYLLTLPTARSRIEPSDATPCRWMGISLVNKLVSSEVPAVPAFLAGVAMLQELISPTTCSRRARADLALPSRDCRVSRRRWTGASPL